MPKSAFLLLASLLLLTGCKSRSEHPSNTVTPPSPLDDPTPTPTPTPLPTPDIDYSKSWRSLLYPADWEPGYQYENLFLHDFSYAGYHYGEDALPQTSLASDFVIDVTKQPYCVDNTGKTDVTLLLQSAIDDAIAQGGGTIYLPAGTYQVSPQNNKSYALLLNSSNLVFKGAGTDQTFLFCSESNMRNRTVLQIGNADGDWNNKQGNTTYDLTEDIPKTPVSTIALSSTNGLSVGDWVIIRSSRTVDWIKTHQMEGFWNPDSNMGTTFYRKITQIDSDNNTITIDIPTRYWMKTSDQARLYVVAPQIEETGICDFSIGNVFNPLTEGYGEEDYKTEGNGAYQVHNSSLVLFAYTANCFAKNISSYAPSTNPEDIHMLSNGMDLNRNRSLTIDHCDFSYPQYEGGGGNGYGFNICSQECLLTNCSATSARHSFAFKYSFASGNVFYQFTSTDAKYASDFHMYLSMSNLIDNQVLNGDFIESSVRPYGANVGNYHGVTSTQTVFWNTTGNYYKKGSSFIIDSRQYGVGYIIGTKGEASAVRTSPTYLSTKYGSVETAPEDYKEGIGFSDLLEPQSLYQDQLSRRLSKSTK